MGSVTSNPNITITLSPSAIVDAFADRRDLILGQIGLTATAAPISGDLNADVHLLTTNELHAKFGADSFLTKCVEKWKAVNEGYSPLDVIALDDGAAAAASVGDLAFTGTATADGTYYVSVVDENEQIEVAVSSTDTAIEIALAISVAYNALVNQLCLAAVPGTPDGSVSFTAVDLGTIGSNYGLKVEGTIPGLTYVITPFTSGTDTPVTTNVFDNIEGIRYTGILWPEDWYSTIATAVTELESRFNATNTIMDGTCFSGMTDTYANDVIAANALDTQVVVLMGSPLLAVADYPDQDGPAILQPADFAACEFMGIRSRRLTTGAPIADDIISNSAGLDANGGPSLASLPYFNTPMRETPVTSSSRLFSALEQAGLEDEGFSHYGVNTAQNNMIMGPTVTTWTTDGVGNENISFHYLNYVDTGSACREVFYRILKSSFAQTRLTTGDLVAGRSMANAESIKAELLRIYKYLSTLALTQAGTEAETFFSANTSVTVDLATRTATIAGPLPIVTQLGTINYSLQLAFQITGTGTQITV